MALACTCSVKSLESPEVLLCACSRGTSVIERLRGGAFRHPLQSLDPSIPAKKLSKAEKATLARRSEEAWSCGLSLSEISPASGLVSCESDSRGCAKALRSGLWLVLMTADGHGRWERPQGVDWEIGERDEDVEA